MDHHQQQHQVQLVDGSVNNISISDPSTSSSSSSSSTTTATQTNSTIGSHDRYADHWVDMHTYEHHLHSLPEYPSFGYLTSDGLSRMAPPPPALQPIQPHPPHPHQSHTQLPMLIMPSHAAWPSMLTNPTGSYSASTLALPITVPATASIPTKTRVPGMHQSHPRRTLTDDDRRKMCVFHQENPHVKQTEIGAMFGVERSTVSKVLRNKDKYLFPEDRTNSALKRSKGKFPDIERALSSWARKAQQSGADPSDSEIWEQARHFARGVASDTDAHIKSLSSSWLEKFKQKNGIGSGRRLLHRRASETNISERAKSSLSMSPALTPPQSSGISPASPPTVVSPLSVSPQEDELKDGGDRFMTFDGSRYKHANSQSTTSLSSAFTDTAGSAFSGETMSPGGTFTFSPDPNVGSFLQTDQDRTGLHQHLNDGSDPLFQRPRSQTFPSLEMEYLNHPSQQHQQQQQGPGSAPPAPAQDFDSCLEQQQQHHQHELTARAFGIDNSVSPPHLRRSSSNGSLAGAGSPPTSPSHEDAQRAAETLLHFIQSGGQLFDQTDYLSIVRLTDKLRLHHHTHNHAQAQSQQQAHAHTKPVSHSLVGGLSRIPEADGDVTPASLSVSTSIKSEIAMVG